MGKKFISQYEEKLRDKFAGQALACMSKFPTFPDKHLIDIDKVASLSYAIADAMLRERSK